jgi:hypothetical protein
VNQLETLEGELPSPPPTTTGRKMGLKTNKDRKLSEERKKYLQTLKVKSLLHLFLPMQTHLVQEGKKKYANRGGTVEGKKH